MHSSGIRHSQYAQYRFQLNTAEAVLRGGATGGSPEGEPAAGAPASAPAAPAGAPSTPAAAPPTPAAAPPQPVDVTKLVSYQAETIEKLTKAIEDLRANGGATEKQLKEAQEALAGFQKLETERADGLFSALPDDSRAKLAPFKEHLPHAQWIKLIEAERAAVKATSPDSTPLPPPTGSPQPPKAAPSDSHTPSSKAVELLRKNMFDDKMLKSLNVKRMGDDESKGQPKFSIDDIKDFFGRMNRGKRRPAIHEVSLAAAAKRDFGG